MTLIPIEHSRRLGSPAEAEALFVVLGERRVSTRGLSHERCDADWSARGGDQVAGADRHGDQARPAGIATCDQLGAADRGYKVA